MRKTSEILQLMIDSGLYHENVYTFMCNALKAAFYRDHIITTDEFEATKAWIKDAIDNGTKGHGTLYGYLLAHGITADFRDTLRWYEDRIAELKAEGK